MLYDAFVLIEFRSQIENQVSDYRLLEPLVIVNFMFSIMLRSEDFAGLSVSIDEALHFHLEGFGPNKFAIVV